jgi:hypothetical protein
VSGEVEAARVQQLERTLRRYTGKAEAYEAEAVPAGAWRQSAARIAGELEDARGELAKAQRPRDVQAADVEPGMMLWNPYGGDRGRFTAASAARVMPDGSVEVETEDGRTGKFRAGFRLVIDWHAIDLQAEAEPPADAGVCTQEEAARRLAAGAETFAEAVLGCEVDSADLAGPADLEAGQ